ncbi:MAG TPA: hypothetical protein VFH17_08315 [Coriobacteriia bacterium]|nr:hypothetical protein [Coriobacteriia bacterium]
MERVLEELKEDSLLRAVGSNEGVNGRNGISKVARYHWKKLEEAGVFKMIPKKDLMLDLNYQREIRAKGKTLEIAREFWWPAFGTLHVADTVDGYFVVEGGRRLRAANLRDDIDKLPCMVYQMGATKEEALAFWKINTSRIRCSAYEDHKGARVAGVEIAMLADDLVKKHGYEFAPGSPRGLQTTAIKTIYWMIQRNRAAADQTFGLLAEVAQGTPIASKELKGLFYVVQMNPSVDFRSFPLDNMISVGIEGLRHQINKFVLIGSTRADHVACGHALLSILNKGQKKTRVILPPMMSSK